MKPGDLIQLKEGTLGLNGSDLYAIYLDRVKESGSYHVVIHTTNGNKQVNKDRVHRTVLKARVDDPENMTKSQLDERLTQLVTQVSTKKRPERRQDLDELDDRRLWELIVNDAPDTFTPTDAAQLLLDDPTQEDINEVRTVLQTCQQDGVGYFERAPGKGERYTAYTVDEIKNVRQAIEGLRHLRNKLIQLEELPPEEEGEEPRTILKSIHPDEANLDEEDEEHLRIIQDQMTDFLLYDTDRGKIGLADTPIHTLDGFILNRFCRFLAYDWLGTRGTTISGAYARFLLETDRIDHREANHIIARRHINLSEFFQEDYPQRALNAADRLPEKIPPDWATHREDLQHLETYTIDPPTAKDFDDAISLEHDGDDTLLYVHIADVAQYVETASTIDWEARSRGTSVYLPTGVLPMLPPKLSEDLCSLREGEPRPAMTVKMRVNPQGEVTDADIQETIIQVDQNLAYDDALDAIDNDQDPYASLHDLATRMRKQRQALELDTSELRVNIRAEAIDPTQKKGNRATRLIEQFMVAANEAVARFLTEHEAPTPYRCHPLPDQASVDTFNRQMEIIDQPIHIELPEIDDEEDEEEGQDFMSALQEGKVELVGGGFIPENEDEEDDDEEETDTSPVATMKGLVDLDEEDRTAYLEPFNDALAKIEDLTDERLQSIIRLKVLGCMGRALYTPANIGHFGLGSTCYLHFTSPIRRYPDLVTHRQIKAILRAQDTDDIEYPHSEDELADLCPKNTDQSIEAEQLERDLVAVAMSFDALGDHWQGEQDALVNGITKGGIFLSLPRGLEARLATSDIPGGPWEVDEDNAMLFKGTQDNEDPDQAILDEILEHGWREVYDESLDEMVNVRMRLGDHVPVRIKNVDLAMGQVSAKLSAPEAQEEER